ncbi:hypothetical protein FX988_01337 [Paraglaciecola mesophila]|uniref:Uncharacterized protein n=1 Tax=Paraglaciecola mesophila TaxID=197222 RepID=A0A857JGK3_9ALTE|nr:hypothetical protein [Paraglaciecola mesophila]QHJ11115.1 hypothetical protein FX988_01337 [Paraglaciecola mesophila]
MFKKFVQITALFNFPIAIGIMIPELLSPQASSFIITLVLASFLICIGAALLWAVSDLPRRAPIIVWNGLVRLFGFVVVTYAASSGMAPTLFIPIAVMDLITAAIYVLGSAKTTGIPVSSLIIGKSNPYQ